MTVAKYDAAKILVKATKPGLLQCLKLAAQLHKKKTGKRCITGLISYLRVKEFCICYAVSLYVCYQSQKKHELFFNNINRLNFVLEKQSFFWKMEAGYLGIIQKSVRIRGLRTLRSFLPSTHAVLFLVQLIFIFHVPTYNCVHSHSLQGNPTHKDVRGFRIRNTWL